MRNDLSVITPRPLEKCNRGSAQSTRVTHVSPGERGMDQSRGVGG